MTKVTRASIPNIIKEKCAKGKMGYVLFTKENGKERKMWFKQIAANHVKGKSAKFSFKERGILPVFDMKIKKIRSFKLSSVKKLSVGGEKYVF